jgi:hypothetical protein
MTIKDWFSKRSGQAGEKAACCSFCQKSYREVGPLIEGTGGVYVCSDCVDLCRTILDQERSRPVATTVPLSALAHGRSGDKGNHANIGIACYTEAAYQHLKTELTPQRVAHHFRSRGLEASRVIRYELPNLLAFNFVLYDVLDGGASRSLRIDSQGKTLALQLLEMAVSKPPDD